ncbi:hypothetical protein ABZS79_17110 [Streptomyces griseoloalbus]|uniref:hypothetical protein n=1 Tax=Streptomyces griseoloalbus TaxID=67303 RepID=UPI0033AAADD5
MPYLTVQSREPAAESLDRRLTFRLRYDGSFWDALHGEEGIDGRDSPLHRSRSTHRIPVLISAPTYLGTPRDTG